MRTFDAPRRRTFRRVELPTALPGVLTGAKIAVVVAVIGAVFAEQAGANSGLGYLFEQVEAAAADRRAPMRRWWSCRCSRSRCSALLTLAERLARAVGLPTERRHIPMIRKLALLMGVAALAALLLAACGEARTTSIPSASGAPTQSLTLMLDWFPNADHVGIYKAQADGDFARAGLDVHIQTPTNPATPLQLLQAGKVDVAVSYEPELMLARDKGAPLVAIGAIVQRPLTAIVSLGSKHIRTAAQLRGKTVGDAGIPYQQAYLKTILQRSGVPRSSVKEVNVGDNLVPAMLSGRVDATLGAYWNYEAIQLAQMRASTPT